MAKIYLGLWQDLCEFSPLKGCAWLWFSNTTFCSRWTKVIFFFLRKPAKFMSASHSVKSLVMGFEESVLCFTSFCLGFGFGLGFFLLCFLLSVFAETFLIPLLIVNCSLKEALTKYLFWSQNWKSAKLLVEECLPPRCLRINIFFYAKAKPWYKS